MAKTPRAPVLSSLDRVIFDPDTIPPSTPTMGTPVVVGQDRIDFPWSTSIDTGGSGLSGYHIQIDGGSPIVLGIQTGYSLTGLASGSTHTARVRAFDANGNIGSYSSLASATTAGASLAWQSGTLSDTTTVNVPYVRNIGDFVTGELEIALLSGSLPTGLTYNAATTTISGTPTLIESQTATYRATDTLTAVVPAWSSSPVL